MMIRSGLKRVKSVLAGNFLRSGSIKNVAAKKAAQTIDNHPMALLVEKRDK